MQYYTACDGTIASLVHNNSLVQTTVKYYKLFIPTSSLFGDSLDVVRVKQFPASMMMLEQLMEILVHQNGLNQPGVAPYI